MRTTALSTAACLILLVSACAGGMSEPGDPMDPMDPLDDTPVTLSIVSPGPDTAFVRDYVGTDGALVALVDVQVDATGPFARIGFELAKGESLGDAGADMAYAAEIRGDGPATIVAHAYADDGRIVATDSVSLMVGAPTAASCHEWLDLYGVRYELGPTREGVADPVTLDLPINGISFRYEQNDSPRSTFFMDCELALSLARAAEHLRRRDIIQVADYGVYNYRCIGEGTPPDCPSGMSQHAFAKGIDITGFMTGDGTFYSVKNDWVIDAAGESTCAASTETPADRFLHEAICEMKAAGLWNIVLTPNYNAAHRDHFHVDLTTGSDYIKSGDVDVGGDHH